jgi:Deacetylases, including yeast histone deacetylase and acetoin utilization protein
MLGLTVITSLPNQKIISEEVHHLTTNKPFTRQEKILSMLSRCRGVNIEIVQNDFAEQEQCVIRSTATDPKYLTFLKNAYPSFVEAGSNEEYVSPFDGGLNNYYFPKNVISDAILDKVPYYLQCGVYSNDFCTSIFNYTYEYCIRSAFNGLLASSRLGTTNVIYCLNVLPGHHATNNLYSGYCFINNAAVCAYGLLPFCSKIAILDLDFHHGDGTQKIFYDNPNVMTISIHGDPTITFPFYSGYAAEKGFCGMSRYNYNFPLPMKTKIDTYHKTLIRALELINGFGPSVVIIPFGADTYNGDPQGGFSLEFNDYELIGCSIREYIKVPMIVTQEGGYCLDVVDNVLYHFFMGLCDIHDLHEKY